MEGPARGRPRDAVGRAVLGLAAAGLVLRLVLDALFGTNGDLVRMERVGGWLAETPLDVYVLQRPNGLGLEWPYLPGAFPLIWAAHELAGVTGKHFETLQRLGPIAANVALVWVVDLGLRGSGRPARERVVAAGVLALGPLLVLESAWHGQLDLIAACFAAAGVVAWERLAPGRRAWAAGALVGAAAAVKTPLGVVILALLPLAASRREAAALAGAAAAVVLAVSAPWLARDAGALLHGALSYHGLPGVAGLNLLVQPELAQRWLTGRPVPASGAMETLDDLALPLALLGLAAAFAVVAARRPPPAAGAALMLLAGYATGVNLATHYVEWVVPFLLLCGWTRVSLALQAALVVPLVMLYWPSIEGTLATPAAPWSATWSNLVYVPWMTGLWLASVAGAVAIARRSSRSHRATTPSQTSWISPQ